MKSLAATMAVAPTSSSSSRRSQPMRQARSNPVRRSTLMAIAKDSSRNAPAAQPHSINQKFYPALTSFTDAIDALPAEIIRNFTLLREVDAKACHPEEQLRRYIAAAKALPPPTNPDAFDPAFEFLRRQEEQRRRREEAVINGENPPPETDFENMEAVEQLQETRRSRLQQVRMVLAELLPMLDEKIHVIAGTVETLNKHNARVQQAYEYLESEIPELYRLGDPGHWGYKPQVPRGSRTAAVERAASAQQTTQVAAASVEDIVAASSRAESRREALARKQAAAAAAAAQEYDDAYQVPGPTKRQYNTARGRKEAELSNQRTAEPQAIASVVASPGSVAPQQKRRKPNLAATGDKAGSEKPNNPRGTTSPRSGTPIGKRPTKSSVAAAGNVGSSVRRRPNATSTAQSPNPASSPVHPAFSPSLKTVNGKEDVNSSVHVPGDNSSTSRQLGYKLKEKHPKETKDISAASNKAKISDTGTEQVNDTKLPGKAAGSKGNRKDSVADTTITKTEGDGDETIAEADGAPLLNNHVEYRTPAITETGGKKAVPGPASPIKKDRDGSGKNPDILASTSDAMEGVESSGNTSTIVRGAADHRSSTEIPHPAPPSTTPNKRASISTSSVGAGGVNMAVTEKIPGGGGKRKRGSVDYHHHGGSTANEIHISGGGGNQTGNTSADSHHPYHQQHHTTISSPSLKNSSRQTGSSHSNKSTTGINISTATNQSDKHTTTVNNTATGARTSRDSAAAAAARGRDQYRDTTTTATTAASSNTLSRAHRPPSSSPHHRHHLSNLKKEKREREDEYVEEEDEEAINEDEEMDDEEEEPDPDEPRYCICNQVSFGDMVGCDNKDCKVEWFHLSCVGLSRPPKKDENWYCNDCKIKMNRETNSHHRGRKGHHAR